MASVDSSRPFLTLERQNIFRVQPVYDGEFKDADAHIVGVSFTYRF